MTYTRKGDSVTLEMTGGEYGELMMRLGWKVGQAGQINGARNSPEFWSFINFMNRLNATNPAFTQCEIPEEFARHADPS